MIHPLWPVRAVAGSGGRALALLLAQGVALAAGLAASPSFAEVPASDGLAAHAAAADPDAEPFECRNVRTATVTLGDELALPLCTDNPKSGTWRSESTPHFKVWWRQEDGPSALQVAKLAVKTYEGSIWPTLTRYVGQEPTRETPDLCPGNRFPGGDSRFDVFVTNLDESRDAMGLTSPVIDARGMPLSDRLHPVATFIRLDRNLIARHDASYARLVMAHEFFHALQFSIGPKTKEKALADAWWNEVSAVWASTLVVPDVGTLDKSQEPSLLCEYLATPAIRISDPNPESRFPLRRSYGGALFALLLTSRNVPKSFVLDVLKKVRTQDQLTAVDRSIPGGFARWWKEYTLFLLNRPPYDRLSQLGSPRKVRTEKVAFGKAGVDRFFAPTKLEGLSATYHHLKLGPEARVVGYQPFPLPAGVSLQVLRKKKLDAQWGPVEDWTEGRGRVFCRDLDADRFDEVLFVLGNSNLEATALPAGGAGGRPLFQSSNRPCAGWTGTHSSRARLYANLPVHHFEATAEAKVDYRLTAADWIDDKATLIYRTERGHLTTSYSSAVCSCPAQPVDQDVPPGEGGLWVQDIFATGATSPYLLGSGGVRLPLACTCPEGQPKAPSSWDFLWIAVTEEQPAPVLAPRDLRGSQRSARSVGDGTFVLEQSWDLAPIRP